MPASRRDKSALLQKMRQQQQKKQGRRDPTEWRPAKVREAEEAKYRLYILPPIFEGDVCIGPDGKQTVAKEDWDVWFYQHGHHYINGKRYECPRVTSGDDCPMCTMGFDLMRDLDDKEAKRAIAKEWLSSERYAVNVYFPDHQDNPEDLRGEVRWWDIPRSIYKQCIDCIKRDDDGGDEDDPLPFGLFFDAEDAYCMLVKVKEKGDWNNYDDSKFIIKRKAIADDSDDVEKILAQRIDVSKRFDEPDVEALNKLVEKKLEEANSGFNHDDYSQSDNNETTPVKEVRQEPVKESKKQDTTEEEDEPPKDSKKAKLQAKAKKEELSSDDDNDDMGDDMKALLAQLSDD